MRAFFSIPLVRIILGIALVGFLIFAAFTWWPIPQIRSAMVAPTPDPAADPGTSAADPTQAPPAADPTQAPFAADPAAPVASGDTVTVTDSTGKTLATIKFVTKVDNMPTEWLKDRPVAYLYQSGIGNRVELEITLYEGGAFAIDGDWATANGKDLGIVDDAADFLLFADAPGTYKVTASSFGLAIGVYNGEDDKAGNVIQDRRNATGWDNRPVFYLSSDGQVVELD